MTVASDVNKCRYMGNGVTRVWPYTFDLPETYMLEVYVTEPGGLPVKLERGYSVDREARSVTYPSNPDEPPLPAGYRLTLRRWVDFLQNTDLRNQGEFFAQTIEGQFDKDVMMIQQLAEAVSRAVLVPVDGQYSPEELQLRIMDAYGRYGEIVAANAESVAARDAAAAYSAEARSAADAAASAKESALESMEAAEAAKETAQEAVQDALAVKEAVLSASSVLPWEETESYSYPDMACCPDGNTYRCIGENVTGEYPPESDLWVRITVIQAAGNYDMESGGTFTDAAASAVSGGQL